jgi:hypothetical protein
MSNLYSITQSDLYCTDSRSRNVLDCPITGHHTSDYPLPMDTASAVVFPESGRPRMPKTRHVSDSVDGRWFGKIFVIDCRGAATA